jgi:hypothetical protein
VTPQPGDQAAAAPDGYGRLRVSRADREQAINTLKAAFVYGRLTKGELDERVGRALVPLTYAELVALTDDIPAGPEPARPRGTGQGMARLRESNAAKAGAFAALVAGMVMIAAVGSGSADPLQVLATVLLLSPVWMLALGGLLLLHSRLDRRATGRPPARPELDRLPFTAGMARGVHPQYHLRPCHPEGERRDASLERDQEPFQRWAPGPGHPRVRARPAPSPLAARRSALGARRSRICVGDHA